MLMPERVKEKIMGLVSLLKNSAVCLPKTTTTQNIKIPHKHTFLRIATTDMIVAAVATTGSKM